MSNSRAEGLNYYKFHFIPERQHTVSPIFDIMAESPVMKRYGVRRNFVSPSKETALFHLFGREKIYVSPKYWKIYTLLHIIVSENTYSSLHCVSITKSSCLRKCIFIFRILCHSQLLYAGKVQII